MDRVCLARAGLAEIPPRSRDSAASDPVDIDQRET